MARQQMTQKVYIVRSQDFLLLRIHLVVVGHKRNQELQGKSNSIL